MEVRPKCLALSGRPIGEVVKHLGLKSKEFVMNRIWNRYGVAVLVVVAVVVALAVGSQLQPAFGRADTPDRSTAAAPHYTVVETEGHNLLVTDNVTNTFYFYTVDKGEPVGSELKLRGTVDLNMVGKPSIKPKAINIQK